jgi:polyhydroxybutyrate depolymerase
MPIPRLLVGLVLILAACGGGDDAATPDAGPRADAAAADAGPDAGPKTEFGGSRPVTLRVPPSYEPGTPMPLVIALHGFSGDSAFIEGYSGFGTLFANKGFLLAAPNGTLGQDGKRFWNATDACCDFFASGVDDEKYLLDLIAEIQDAYSVDAKRVYLIGFSNGAFMAYRMACHHADKFAALVSLSGATYDDALACAPSAKVSVLQVHGDVDETIKYGGGQLKVNGVDKAYPSAQGTIDRWSGYDACADTQTPAAAIDFSGAISGAETQVLRRDGCTAGVDVELWTVTGGGHVLAFGAASQTRLWDWLAAHSKP